MATYGNMTTPYQVATPPTKIVRSLKNAVTVEGTYSEPTIGQIWPR